MTPRWTSWVCFFRPAVKMVPAFTQFFELHMGFYYITCRIEFPRDNHFRPWNKWPNFYGVIFFSFSIRKARTMLSIPSKLISWWNRIGDLATSNLNYILFQIPLMFAYWHGENPIYHVDSTTMIKMKYVYIKKNFYIKI